MKELSDLQEVMHGKELFIRTDIYEILLQDEDDIWSDVYSKFQICPWWQAFELVVSKITAVNQSQFYLAVLSS